MSNNRMNITEKSAVNLKINPQVSYLNNNINVLKIMNEASETCGTISKSLIFMSMESQKER